MTTPTIPQNRIKPQLPNGMRDFLPADMLRRQYVIDTIADVFQSYGFEPLQTPALELNETLLGKYGEDAEKMIYHTQHALASEAKMSLRYDLTVPLARVYGMSEAKLALPFKRYQMAPVWRGERPGRGRFREFYQCGADTVGIAGMEADAEILSLGVTALRRLGFTDFVFKVNNRKLLTGIGQYAGLSGEPLGNLYRSIDKLDKIGVDGVKEEMIKGGLEADVVTRIMNLISSAQASMQTTDAEGYAAGRAVIGTMRDILKDSPMAMEGLDELDTLNTYLEALSVPGQYIDLDFATVRGLGYYTGPIFEAVLLSNDPEERVGSIAGGGRYDDLIGLFRKESLPTVGLSLGIERLITLMDKRQMYPASINRTVVQVLVTVFGPDTRAASMSLASALREAAVKTELFMQDSKLGKQIGYADKKGIPVIAVIGPDELAKGLVKVKRLADQHEIAVPRDEAVAAVQGLLDNR